jgi:hypothetical protein
VNEFVHCGSDRPLRGRSWHSRESVLRQTRVPYQRASIDNWPRPGDENVGYVRADMIYCGMGRLVSNCTRTNTGTRRKGARTPARHGECVSVFPRIDSPHCRLSVLYSTRLASCYIIIISFVQKKRDRRETSYQVLCRFSLRRSVSSRWLHIPRTGGSVFRMINVVEVCQI